MINNNSNLLQKEGLIYEAKYGKESYYHNNDKDQADDLRKTQKGNSNISYNNRQFFKKNQFVVIN